MSTPDPTDSTASSTFSGNHREPTPPGEGERRAQRGYTNQYAAAAAAIYQGLDGGNLRWVGLADRQAGIADDVVLGYSQEAIGHQFKTSLAPGSFRIRTLFAGANGLLRDLVTAWQRLTRSCPGMRVRIRVVVSDTPSSSDDANDGAGSTRDFVAQWQRHPAWAIEEWRSSRWWPTIDYFRESTELDERHFSEFFQSLELVHGAEPDFAARYGITAQSRPQVERIAQRLPTIIADNPNKDRWTREEFLEEMGWRDTVSRHHHQFPIGIAVQRNPATEDQLRRALNGHESGYISLIGPPGSGKSTLLQIALEAEPQLVIVRYLAFVPGTSQGIGRAEASDFYEDLIVGLRRSGLHGVRFRRENLQDQREEFEALLGAAGQRYRDTGVRTLLVIDGLDHIPREERPERSLLSVLPLPATIPDGVIFLLGSQRLELPQIPPSVQAQADSPTRRVDMSPLLQDAVTSIADILGLPPSVPRSRLLQLAHGHPLATHYLIQALLGAESGPMRDAVLEDGFEYSGDIEAYYASALREIAEDDEVMDVLRLVALAEAPLELSLLDRFYEPATLERAWRAARHLLKRVQGGWTIFHNSFRLYVARKPRMRFGEPDLHHTETLYRRLVDIAGSAGSPSAQRFLKLRYLMRLGEHAEVLETARPAFFRAQYLAGRSASAIQDDIRLAFASLKHVCDATAAFHLLLSSDEIARRSSTFEEGHETLQALIALGQIAEAEEFFDEVGGDGYLVLDAWLARGAVDRARALYERIEPLHDLGSDSLTSGPQSRRRELERWAAHAVAFRSADEINAGVDRILEVVNRDRHPFDDPEELGCAIRWEAALATVRANPRTNVDNLITAYHLDAQDRGTLYAYAAELLLLKGEQEEADVAIAALDEIAADPPTLAELPRGLRRRVALLLARMGAIALARRLWDGLEPPSVRELDRSTDFDVLPNVISAIVEHAELVTLLLEPRPEVADSEKPLLAPLQRYAETAGRLAARSRRAPDQVPVGEAVQACESLLRYVCRSRPSGGSDYFDLGQLDRAAPVLLRSLLESAARLGESTVAQAVQAVDRILADGSSDRSHTFLLEEAVAEATAYLCRDRDDAARRLELLLDRRDQTTPGQFLDSTARVAKTFGQIGRVDRGIALLSEQRAETLGYALRAKKDPQYAFWMTLLRNACRVDPARRADRVRALTRQAVGMASTEGRDAAYRMAHGLIHEAALDSARTASAVIHALLEADLIELPDVVDALSLGSVQRNPRLLALAVDVWGALCLPFHRSAYYRVDHECDFIRYVIGAAQPVEVEPLATVLLDNIMVHSQVDVRPDLFRCLQASLVDRRVSIPSIAKAERVIASDPPLPRSGGGTPMQYDDVLDMRELAGTLAAESRSATGGYEAARAFQRLIKGADFQTALEVFEQHADIREDNRARFALVDLALEVGRRDTAIRLTNEYRPEADRSFSWSWMMGGGRQRYFAARLKLEGAGIHELAYENFTSTLVAGDDAISSLLWDIGEIWPLLDPSPAWPNMWAAVEEQLSCTRDHSFGAAVVVGDDISDSRLFAELVTTVVGLPVAQLQWHAGRAALALAMSHPETFEELTRTLLTDGGDSAISGLRLLRSTGDQSIWQRFESMAAQLANDADFGVRLVAQHVLRAFGREPERANHALPSFYDIAIPRIDLSEPGRSLRQTPFGPPLVSDAVSWCAPLSDLIEDIAAISGVTESHICHRVQQLIDTWGGVQRFGPAGSDAVRERLTRLGFRFSFIYPHISIALEALRHVAGDLEGAGRIGPSDADAVLRKFRVSSKWARTAVDWKPTDVLRPLMPTSFASDDSDWVDRTHEDLASDRCSRILAEVTSYTGRSSSTTYMWSRMRLLGTELPLDIDPIRLFDGLSCHRFPVNSVEEIALEPIPRFQIALDPAFAQALNWRLAADGTTRWLNENEDLIATAYCWRDGGADGQGHGNCLYGEGALILLSEVGHAQLEAFAGRRLQLHSVARRAVTRNGRTRDGYAGTGGGDGRVP